VNTPPVTHRETPDKEAIALLPPFERLGLDRITLVNTGKQAQRAHDALIAARAWGFDTESKPTFKVGERSDGPHVLQLSTHEHAWVFQLHDPECRAVAADLLSRQGMAKAGFGLGDDRKRIIEKLGVEPAEILELNTVFRAQGYRKDMGVKGAVAVLFSWCMPPTMRMRLIGCGMRWGFELQHGAFSAALKAQATPR
jgi:hypothetical protein